MKARLYVAGGASVSDTDGALDTDETQFVAEVEIPPFNEWPRVLLWGSRVFAHIGDNVPDTEGVIPGYYNEAFAYAIVRDPGDGGL